MTNVPAAPSKGKAPVRLPELARALGGDVVGRQVLCPGPGHSPRDRSLSVTPAFDHPDGFIVHSHAGDDWRDCRAHVRARLGTSDRHVISPHRATRPAPRASTNVSALARELWDEAHDPCGTVVERYLASRRLRLPAEVANAVVR